MTEPSDIEREIIREVEDHFTRYLNALNARDVDTAVEFFIHPYFDVRTPLSVDVPSIQGALDGKPTLNLLSEEESRLYFTEAAEGRDPNSNLVARVQVWPLGRDIAQLLAEFVSGPPTGRRSTYILVRPQGEWKFAGYVALDAGFSGPSPL
jgi:hypothetical protein